VLDALFWRALYAALIAGHMVTGIAYSAWLLMFSMVYFPESALMKSFVNADVAGQNEWTPKAGATRWTTLNGATLGLVSGYLAVLVLELYVNSPQVLGTLSTSLLRCCDLSAAAFTESAGSGCSRTAARCNTIRSCSRSRTGQLRHRALSLALMWLATGR